MKKAYQTIKHTIITVGIGQKLAEHMIKNAAENLEGYNSKDVMKKLFGIY